MDKLVHSLSKLVLSQDKYMVWLINLHEQQRFVDVLSFESTGCSLPEVNTIINQSINELLQDMLEFPDWDVHNFLSVHFSQDVITLCKRARSHRMVLVSRLRVVLINQNCAAS
jgi:hypothetical protein